MTGKLAAILALALMPLPALAAPAQVNVAADLPAAIYTDPPADKAHPGADGDDSCASRAA